MCNNCGETGKSYVSKTGHLWDIWWTDMLNSCMIYLESLRSSSQRQDTTSTHFVRTCSSQPGQYFLAQHIELSWQRISLISSVSEKSYLLITIWYSLSFNFAYIYYTSHHLSLHRAYSLVDSSRVSTFLISILLIVYGSFRWETLDVLLQSISRSHLICSVIVNYPERRGLHRWESKLSKKIAEAPRWLCTSSWRNFWHAQSFPDKQ